MREVLRKPAVIAVIVVLLPFAVSCGSESTTRVNGRIRTYSYFDIGAIACAVIAVVLVVRMIALARREKALTPLVLTVAAVVTAVALFQGVKGTGLIVDRTDCRSDSAWAAGLCRPADR